MLKGLPAAKPGAVHAPLTQLVAQAIRARILSGALAPGERLVEAHWSQALGVSRVPVREALRTLAAEGVVTIEPRRGATVTGYTAEQVHELVEVRATLEGLNARLAAKRRDRELLQGLERRMAAGAQVTEKSSLAKLQQDNDDFHETLARAASNSVLQDLVRMLRERTAVIFAPHAARRTKETWDEHGAILRAVIDGDAELAALLAARHVHSAAQALPAHLLRPVADEAAGPRALGRTGT